MIYPWLVVFFNFSGISFVEIPKIASWKESNLLKVFFFVKLIVLTVFFLNLWWISRFEKYVFDSKVVDGYSGFSIEILELSFKCFHFCGLVLLVIQYRCRRKMLKFLKSFKNYKLKESSKIQLKKRIAYAALVNLVFLVVNGSLLSCIVLRNNFLIIILSFYIVMQTHFNYCALVLLFVYSQSFVVVALKEVKVDIKHHSRYNNNNHSRRENGLENFLLNLEKIENVLEAFYKTFGPQLTIVTTTYTFLVVTIVSSGENFISNYP